MVYFEKRNEGVPKTEIPKKESVFGTPSPDTKSAEFHLVFRDNGKFSNSYTFYVIHYSCCLKN